ncbi:DgyrCDS9115 [Dimorphilus gyrociliatus]|uniref:DgyrCDS9115 n=1 Tax=Dimorphilus gyrociliatus TaxID=2664684 RepID=A0A7I8W1C0_9ANNE|nr:DgyrCDS9115 [Dimorphilus gyrociliatus]
MAKNKPRRFVRNDYNCSLDADDEEIAKAELNELPSDRLTALQCLSDWIQDTEYIKCPLRTDFLLPFLRQAKFSQIKARKKIETYSSLFQNYPDYFANLDPNEEQVQYLFNTGFMVPLGLDKNKSQVFYIKMGLLDTSGTNYTSAHLLRALMIAGIWTWMSSERTQIRGTVFIMDLEDYTWKRFMFIDMDKKKMISKNIMGCVPVRFKAVHLINYNLIVDSFVSILKPLDPGKFFKRIVRHNTLESLYDREVPREILPAELLPDEDSSKANGTFKDLTEKFKQDILNHRETIMKMTDTNSFHVDESLKVLSSTNSSYRKLGLD